MANKPLTVTLENIMVGYLDKQESINTLNACMLLAEFLSVPEIEQKCGLTCNIMTYNKLKDAIPKHWRKLLKTMQVTNNAINFNEHIHLKIGKNTKPINQITNHEIYWILVNKKQQKTIIIEKYKHELDIKEDQWENIFTIPKVIRDTKIRAFQYKLLFNLTPCNLYLKRIKRSETDRCNWCHEIDDTAHYFAECKDLNSFWTSFAQWYAGMTNKSLTVTVENIMIGYMDKQENN
jgi:hypothetical protein